MAEAVVAVATNTVGNLAAEYASPYLSYFFRFGKIVEDFKNRRNQLELRKVRVKNDVDEALRQTEVIEKDVEEWLTRAEKELGEAQSLEDEIERKKCFNWCPSWGWRYCLSKKAAKKTLCISQLLETCNFPRVGQRAPLQGIELLPKDFMCSESSTLAFNGIMKALKSDGVKMIGLYGMPGVGKTTLADVVLKQATEQKLFDKVVSVTVSQTPNLNEIQARIAELFGLKFEAITEKGKAEELLRRLKGEKKILIILDDVWKELELQTIGIPFDGEHEGCKILLTTRLQQICIQMNCQEKFELKILSEDEAWALFKDKAGLKDDSPTLNVAKEVARECNGLPLAIVTVANALKGESLDGWIAANKRLKSSRHLDNQHVCGRIYRCLKLSYDYLDQDNIKHCFLLCSLFPEDYEISIELLTVIGLGQGLFCHINLIEELRREIRQALSMLQKFGLLLETNDEFFVKMHDVVRDFAHWTTASGENMFMVKNDLTEWPKSENFDCYTAISLWNSKIGNFCDRLKFLKLKILILVGDDYQIIPSTFFEGMKTLQVLFLERFEFSMKAFQFLTNLRTLSFIRCHLFEDISSLRNLTDLEFLELVKVDLEELPKELVELRKLKSLYFSCFGDGPINVPHNLLSRLTSLQELHVARDNNANLVELNSLSRLTTLTLSVSTEQCSQENFVFAKRQSYSIAVNAYIEFPEKHISRILTINDFSSLNAFKELFPNVQKLTLFKVMEHKTVVPNVDQWGLNELTSLQLTSCDDLECLIDTTREQSPTTAFSNLVNLDIGKLTSLQELCHGESPNSFLQNLETLIICDCGLLQSVFQMNGQMRPISNLRSLELQSLPALESIWKEPTHHVSLQSLKDVKVDGCDKLESIFSSYLAQSLLHLEQLKISACKKLEQVFAFAKDMAELEENQAPPLSNLICLELESLPELRCIWREPTHLVNLQSLKTMRIGLCSKLEYLFSPTLAQALVHLEELKIKESNSLKHLIMEAENGDEIVSNKDRTLLCWPKLKSLEIASCKSLRYVFPITLAQGLPYLESFQIIDCPQLMHVFNMAKDEDKHDIVLPKLQFLRLEDLENLRSFCPRNCFVKLPSFKGLEVCNVGLRPQVMSHSQNQQGLPSQFQLKDTEIDAVKELLYNVKSLSLERVMYHKNLVPNVDPKGLNELTFLALKDGKELECLIDTTEGYASTTAFFNLVELVIQDMTSMKMLCNGRFPKGFLQKLEKLEARNCMEMVSLSPVLQDLKEVKVVDCGQLQQVFQIDELLHDTEENQGPLLSNLTLMELHLLPEMKWIWKGSTQSVRLQSLKVLEISFCNSLEYLFSPSLAQSLLHLEQLKISACKKLEQVFAFVQDMAEPEAPPLTNLTCLELESLPELRCIWREPTHLVNLQSLKTMRICSCFKLEYLFSPTLARALVHLEELSIKESNSLKHLIMEAENGDQIVSNKDRTLLCWPKLKSLEIASCKSLRYVFPITLAQGLPYLESVQIIDCPQLMHVFNMAKEEDKHDVVLSKLQFLRLGDLENLRSFCPRNCFVKLPSFKWLEVCNVGPRPQDTEIDAVKELLYNVKSLSLERVMYHKNLVPNVDPKGLNELTFLALKDGKELECLIDTTEGYASTTAFFNLVELVIQDMASMKMLCNGRFPKGFLQKLEKLEARNCMEMVSLSPVLQDLKEVKVVDCGQLQQVFQIDELLHDTEENQGPLLSNLTLMELHLLPEMKWIWKGSTQSVRLQSLKVLEISFCNSLEYIFSPSLAQSLLHLEQLKISACKKLEQVFAFVQDMAEPEAPPLSNLTCLELESLPELRCIWREPTHLVNLQSLKTMRICSCFKLEYLFSPTLARALVHLEELSIKESNSLKHLIMEAENGDQIVSNKDRTLLCWPKLKSLEIASCKSLRYVFPITLAQGLPYLESVQIIDCPQLMHVFNMAKEEDKHDVVLSKLQFLRLGDLENLRSFCPRNCFVKLPSFKWLEVCNVGPRPQVMSHSQNQQGLPWQFQLKDTEIDAVKELLYNVKSLAMERVMYHKNLVPNVDPKGLNELTFLALKDGKELECLIDTTEGYVSTTAFFNLVKLVIQDMTSMKMLCNGRFPKGFLQKLEKLEATNCMEMVSLSPALQDLKEVKVINCGQLQEVFQIDELLHDAEEPLLSNLVLMELQLLPQLQWICKGSTHFVRLQSLKILEISFCNSLKYLFSPSLAQSLVLLEQLKIYHCYGLQHIINELDCDDGIEPNAHLHSPFLPKLETLTISNCPRLDYVFQISLAQVPPRLKFVWISDSPQLQQVFNVAKEKHGVDHAIALPCLQQLQLGNLINLSCFFSENFLITSPSLENLVFWDCPKLTNFTIQKEVNEQAQLKDLGLHAMKDLLYNAKSLTLKGVMHQKNLVPNVDPKGLNELTFLTLKDGKELECLIDTTEGHVSTHAFFNLVQLVIQEMTGFKMLCNGRIPKGFLQKLEKLETTNCMELVSLSPTPQTLKEVKVFNCGQLQEVFQIDELLHDAEENQGPLQSNLTLMVLYSLPELKWIWKGSTHFVSLQSLKFVEISYCNRLKYLFSPFLAQSLVLLEQLKIDHCNGLQHIITELECDDEIESDDHPYSPLLPKLESLTISDCPKLEYVFQIPLAQVLPRLKFVWISNSPQLQQLFNVTKEENGVGRAIVLPCLQDLRLGNLINLSCFCSKNFLIASSSLEKLVVFNCPKLTNFTIQKEINQQAQLKELYLSDLGNDKGCNTINSQSRWSVVNLEYLTVGNCVKIFQMQAGQFFSRVENIQLEHLHQLQGPIQVASLQCLRWLHVSKCNRLKYLLSPMLVRNLPHLTHLEINHCEELEEIIEMDQASASSSSQAHLQPISFPRLEIIRIYKCSNLKSLFPLSITCSPSKVKIISIDGASKLERVFDFDIEDDQKGIVLPNLQGLLLKELPSLKSLSQGYHFRFPCMYYVEVKECPTLSTSFSIDSKRVVHAITEAPEQVENDRGEGLITEEEIVDNQAACNDVFWLCGYQEDTLPLYMNVDEAEDN